MSTNSGTPFSFTLPEDSDLADLVGVFLKPALQTLNTYGVHTTATQTLTNKTLTSPTLTNPTVGTGVLTLQAGTAGAPALTTSGDTNTGTFYPAADTIAWATGGSERIRVDPSGNVGIGTGSPSQTLDVNGTIRSASGFVWGTQGAIIDEYVAGNQIRMYTNTAGKVGWFQFPAGMSVNNPLYVYASSGGTSLSLTDSVNNSLYVKHTSGPVTFGTDAGGQIAFATNGFTERMRITSSGDVGIGTSSPEEPLHVKGTAAWVQPIIDSSSSSTGGSALLLRANQNTWQLSSRSSANGVTNNGFSIYESLNNAIRFVIAAGGNVGIGTSSPGYQLTLSTDSAAKPTSNTWTISSDARVKTVLGDFTRGLMDIVGLMPKRYHLNGAYGTVDDGREHVSVIAQDVQTTWPAMVGEYTHVEKDEEAGTETETTLLSLNTNELQWALVNAIKELTARVVTLEQAAA